MTRTLDYYFSIVSPWAYIGHEVFMEIVSRHGLKVNYKPVMLGQVFSQTGGLPLPQRHPARQRYRVLELQRWRDRRGLTFNVQPRHWPFDPSLADRALIGLVNQDGDADTFLRAAYEAIWEQERNLADPAAVAAVLEEAQIDPEPVLEAARSSATEVIYVLNTENAVAADAFGSPAYVLDGEVFWGQDRLELLDDALASGRAAYKSAV